MTHHDAEREVQDGEDHSREQSVPSGRSLAEWITLGISASILLAILGMITWLEFGGANDPPRIVTRAELENVRNEDTGYYVPVTIENTGHKTIEDAVIEAQLDSGEGEPEVAEITVTFLAGGEHVRGAFVFTSDPRAGELTIRPVSYKEP
jgi:uncharacterized protein (TIGR02588 family)